MSTVADRQGAAPLGSRWWNPGERRGRPVLPVGARRPADKAREGGIPGVFRPKRNDERRESDAVQPGWIAGRTPRGFCHGLLALDRDGRRAWEPVEPQPPPCPDRRAGHPQGAGNGPARPPVLLTELPDERDLGRRGGMRSPLRLGRSVLQPGCTLLAEPAQPFSQPCGHSRRSPRPRRRASTHRTGHGAPVPGAKSESSCHYDEVSSGTPSGRNGCGETPFPSESSG